jgi:uncharacterized protein YndB with AHSA1/START domain
LCPSIAVGGVAVKAEASITTSVPGARRVLNLQRVAGDAGEERLVATFQNTVMIRRPIEEVFAFLAEFENIPRWNYAIVETHKVSQGPVGVGTIYQQVRSVPSRSEERFEVTAYNPPHQLEIRGQLGPFPSRLAYALDAVPEGTRVTNSVELELRGPGRLLGRVAVPRVRDAVAANLRKLKELLEQ